MYYVGWLNNEGGILDEKVAKLAYDLAYLLDNPLLDVSKAGWNAPDIAELREEVFHDFCALCSRQLLPVPPYEKDFFEVNLPKKLDEKKRAVADKRMEPVSDRLLSGDFLERMNSFANQEAKVCLVLAKTLQIFPDCDNRGINFKNILAVINSNLVQMGLEPVRPDYGTREVKTAANYDGHAQRAVIAIFDDDPENTISTARSLAGWPNLEIELLLHKSEYGVKDDEGKLKTALGFCAKQITDSKAKIVLMDQGLVSFDGHQLIEHMRKTCSSSELPIFVANTGGGPDKLYAVGALENCDKGEKLRGVVEAIRLIC